VIVNFYSTTSSSPTGGSRFLAHFVVSFACRRQRRLWRQHANEKTKFGVLDGLFDSVGRELGTALDVFDGLLDGLWIRLAGSSERLFGFWME
jgi:hypothetical protein